MAFCVSSFRTGHLYGSFSARLTRRRAWMRLPIRRNSHCESTLEFENYVGGRTRHVKTGRTSRFVGEPLSDHDGDLKRRQAELLEKERRWPRKKTLSRLCRNS